MVRVVVKKEKKADAVASSLYGQTLNGHNSFYTIPCAFIASTTFLNPAMFAPAT